MSVPIPQVEEINNSILRLETKLLAVKHTNSDLNNSVLEYRKAIEQRKLDLENINLKIESLSQLESEFSKIEYLNNRQALVIGRISLWHQEFLSFEENDLEEKMKTLQLLDQEIENILSKVSKESKNDILSSLLNIIGIQMTEWANRLDLEYATNPYRLDLKNLTVVADTPEKPIAMRKMGSAENWLGCHLIGLLALHKTFITKNRPVPGFLVLDQPTQAYFPSDIYKKLAEEDTDEIKDEDLISVENMYDFLFDFCANLSPNFQIIVLDHASILNNRFQEALVEKPWRNGHALIPIDWIK